MKTFRQLVDEQVKQKKRKLNAPAQIPGEKGVMKLIVPMQPTIDNVSSTMVGDQINQA